MHILKSAQLYYSIIQQFDKSDPKSLNLADILRVNRIPKVVIANEEAVTAVAWPPSLSPLHLESVYNNCI
jgi:hypothetical protein